MVEEISFGRSAEGVGRNGAVAEGLGGVRRDVEG